MVLLDKRLLDTYRQTVREGGPLPSPELEGALLSGRPFAESEIAHLTADKVEILIALADIAALNYKRFSLAERIIRLANAAKASDPLHIRKVVCALIVCGKNRPTHSAGWFGERTQTTRHIVEAAETSDVNKLRVLQASEHGPVRAWIEALIQAVRVKSLAETREIYLCVAKDEFLRKHVSSITSERDIAEAVAFAQHSDLGSVPVSVSDAWIRFE